MRPSRLLLIGLVMASACSGPQVVTLDGLEARLAGDPNDVDTLRELGILHARDHSFQLAAKYLARAHELAADDARTLYHYGLVSEVLRDETLAMRLYERYRELPHHSPYRERLFGRYHRLLRRQLRTELREALAREDELAALPAGSAVAVLPFNYRGRDPRFQPLGRGFAELIMADLANVEGLTVVERVRTQVLLAELEHARRGELDAQTAPRLGRLIRAGRLVGGQYDAEERSLRVDATVVETAAEGLPDVSTTEGPTDQLLEVQRAVVASILAALGIELDEERRMMLAASPVPNIEIFLVFSRGLQAEDLDDLDLASRYYRDALRRDPGFTMAAERADVVDAMRAALANPASVLSASAIGVAPGGAGASLWASVAGVFGRLVPGRTSSERAGPEGDDGDDEGAPAFAERMQPPEVDVDDQRHLAAAVDGVEADRVEDDGLDPDPEGEPWDPDGLAAANDIDVSDDEDEVPDVDLLQTSPPAHRPASHNLLSTGLTFTAFDYASVRTAYPYAFRGPVRTILFRGHNSSFRLVSGSRQAVIPAQSGDATGAIVSQTSVFEIELTSGGDIHIAGSGLPVPFEVFVPIRLYLDYRRLATDEAVGGADAAGAAHLPGAGLGAGLGGSARIPNGIGVLENRVVAAGSVSVNYGGMMEVYRDVDLSHLRSTRGFGVDLEVRLERIVGDQAGFSIGYSFLSKRWSDDYVRQMTAHDGTEPWHQRLDNLRSRVRHHFVRIGVNW